VSVDFSALLRSRRLRAGLSQETLAERAGISVDAVSGHERGLRWAPKRETVAALADALQLAGEDRAEFETSAERKRPAPRATHRPANNLPWQRSSFVGRETEIAHAGGLLAKRRVVTLLGPGGMGKTRMALEVASHLAPQKDGIWFVDLAAIGDAALVPAKIAAAVEIELPDHGDPLVPLISALQTRELAIVLDNCEHVIAAARIAAASILDSCPDVTLLATSREPLAIAGEMPYRLEALPLAPAGTETVAGARAFAALELFVQRAETALHDFELCDDDVPVAIAICRRLDGIPLAIELAAARVPVFGLSGLHAQVSRHFAAIDGSRRDLPARQQTLSATLAWSHDLLDEAETILFRRLAIFAPVWTLDAAESICADERLSAEAAASLLASLVDKSLVTVDARVAEPRYRFLEPTRQFALARLNDANEYDEVAARHCTYFATAARLAGESYWRSDSDLWMRRTLLDLENFRDAMTWGFAGDRDVTSAAAIAGSLRYVWFWTSRRDGRAFIERASATLPPDAPARVRGMLELARATLSAGSASATLPASEAARLLKDLDGIGYAEALVRQGMGVGPGRVADATALTEDGVRAARGTHEPRPIAFTLTFHGYWSGTAGDRIGARAAFDEAEALLRACDDRRHLALVQSTRAEFLFGVGDLDGSLANVNEAIDAYRECSAESLLGVARLNEAAYLIALGRFDDAAAAVREALDLALRVDIAHWVRIAIGHIAHIFAETGDAERAALLLWYVDEDYHRAGEEREITEQRGHERTLQLVRASISDDELAALRVRGAGMDRLVILSLAKDAKRPPVSQRAF
jgi:predicted ATPase/DNA-binding XRE family transcriptional regulator